LDVVEAWRKSGGSKCACTQCFYCERALDRHEHDHYPVPRRRRGNDVVPICLVCHDLKDRIFLSNWAEEARVSAVHELANAIEEGFSLWQEPRTISEFVRNLPSKTPLTPAYVFLYSLVPVLEEHWEFFSPLARILLAKMRGALEDTVEEGSDQSELIDLLASLRRSRE
jgi:hypothetical protein